ncbi:MAG: MFS transporter [Chloroflexota bacterium]
MSAITKTPKVFFGWWTVLATGLLCIWGYGFYSVGFSALFKPISLELGLSRATTSVARSLGQFEGGFEAPIVGWLSDRIGPKMVIIFGITVMGVGLLLMNFVHALWSFYLIWGVIVSTGLNIGLSLSVEKAISNWFVKKRGTALSFRWISVVLSTVLIVPLISWLIITVGWRMTCVFGGIVMLVAGLPLAWFFVKKERPEHYGLLPDGAKPEAATDKSQMVAKGVAYAARSQEIEFTLRQAMRTPAFWLLILGYIGFQMTITTVFTHSIPFITDMGISAVAAAGVMSLAGAIGIPFRFAGGFTADKLKKHQLRFLMGGSFLVLLIGVLVFITKQSMATVYAFLILFYIGQGIGIILNSMIRARYFGRKGFGSIQGASTLMIMPFAVAGPIFAGWVFDKTGTYVLAFQILAALLALGIIFVFFAAPPKPPAQVTDINKII